MINTNTSVRVRFAPSPTGKLHIGNIRVAVLNWLLARKNSGVFMLRMDDTDTERSTKAFEQGIKDDLQWLGLNWDEFEQQSLRNDAYQRTIDKMKEMGRLYACYDSQEELDLKRRVLLSQGKPPVYDRAGLNLTDQQRQELEAQGRKPHWRFLLDREHLAWRDLARGEINHKNLSISDPVLIREDGRPLYTLTSVVDDIEFNINHILRGEDHIVNTTVQVQMFHALGAPIPMFAHLPLIKGADGKGLSKRLGSLAISDLRETGIDPQAINAYLARLGTALSPTTYDDLTQLTADFNLENYSNTAPKYDPDSLFKLNIDLLHRKPFNAVKDSLSSEITENFWLFIRDNITALSEVQEWWNICNKEQGYPLQPDDREFIAAAAATLLQLSKDSWNKNIFKDWMDALKPQTERKGKSLFHPLRQALTGRSDGPQLGELLHLIGRERAVKRLKSVIQVINRASN